MTASTLLLWRVEKRKWGFRKHNQKKALKCSDWKVEHECYYFCVLGLQTDESHTDRIQTRASRVPLLSLLFFLTEFTPFRLFLVRPHDLIYLHLAWGIVILDEPSCGTNRLLSFYTENRNPRAMFFFHPCFGLLWWKQATPHKLGKHRH